MLIDAVFSNSVEVDAKYATNNPYLPALLKVLDDIRDVAQVVNDVRQAKDLDAAFQVWKTQCCGFYQLTSFDTYKFVPVPADLNFVLSDDETDPWTRPMPFSAWVNKDRETKLTMYTVSDQDGDKFSWFKLEPKADRYALHYFQIMDAACKTTVKFCNRYGLQVQARLTQSLGDKGADLLRQALKF